MGFGFRGISIVRLSWKNLVAGAIIFGTGLEDGLLFVRIITLKYFKGLLLPHYWYPPEIDY